MRGLYTLCLLGPASAAAALGSIALSWLLNADWFRFTANAFSDLGAGRSHCPWLFNGGLIVSGVLLALHSTCIVLAEEGRLGVLGGGYLLAAGLFLALIGVFPEDTDPHSFIAAWFFLQAYAALSLLAAQRLLATTGDSEEAAEWAATLGLAVSTIPSALLLEHIAGWPSLAVLEAYGVTGIVYTLLRIDMHYLRTLHHAALGDQAGKHCS